MSSVSASTSDPMELVQPVQPILVDPDQPAGIETRLPEECLQNVVDHLAFVDTKSASLLNHRWHGWAKKRLFSQLNLSAPPFVSKPNDQGYAVATLARKLSFLMHALSSKTFAAFRSVSITFGYNEKETVLSDNYKFWSSILHLMTSLRYVKIVVSIPAAAVAVENEFASKDTILLAFLEIIAQLPSKPRITSLLFSGIHDRTRKDWLGRLATMKDSNYVKAGRSTSSLTLPSISLSTSKEVETLLSCISSLQPTTMIFSGIKLPPLQLGDIRTYGLKVLNYGIIGEEKEDQESVLDQVARIIQIFPTITHLELSETDVELQRPPLVPLNMPNLLSLFYLGQAGHLFLSQLEATSLRDLQFCGVNLDIASMIPIIRGERYPCVRTLTFGEDFTSRVLNTDWLDSYKVLHDLTKQKRIELRLEIEVDAEYEYPEGTETLLRLLADTLVSATSMPLALRSGHGDAYKFDCLHFAKLTTLGLTITPISIKGTRLPGFSWFVAWLAATQAPFLTSLSISAFGCEGVDFALAIAGIVKKGENFPRLKEVDIILHGMDDDEVEPLWALGYRNGYMASVKAKFKELCGPSIRGSVCDY